MMSAFEPAETLQMQCSSSRVGESAHSCASGVDKNVHVKEPKTQNGKKKQPQNPTGIVMSLSPGKMLVLTGGEV